MPKRRRVFEPKIDRTPPNLQKLVRLIFSEAYLPGDRLVERDLAAKLELSRVPVREGLQKLVSKGIFAARRGEPRFAPARLPADGGNAPA
jgi:DNA-binding GntR family transcriptional regulator